MIKPIINIGILAHVDAGKTTLTEDFLYLSGVISSPGNVDKGTAQSDFLDVEKERGISVQSSTSTFYWNDVQINLIDTPGHIDFSADVERSLRILDGAILVISAVEGVQAHTENIWLALKEKKIPTIIFINKIDRVGADNQRVIDEIKNELSNDVVVLQSASNEGEADSTSIIHCWNNDFIEESTIEGIANCSDVIMEKYLNDEVLSFSELDKELADAISHFSLTPIMLGAAKSMLGIEDLLNAVINYIPIAKGSVDKPFSALVYKIDYHSKLGKIAGVRLYNGKLSTKEIVKNTSQNIEEKINQLKRYKSGKLEACNTVEAGDVVAVFGLNNAKVGDILGSGELVPDEVELNSPLLTVQVVAEKDKDYPALAEALKILSDEDPALQFEWLKEDKELHVKIMGWIQIQVIEKILEQRFNIVAKFNDPTIIYKESPKTTAEGFARYWMPKPCWAIIKLKIEPGELGSGVVYNSVVGVNDIQKKYQNEVERTINTALKQGPKGWEVTDLIITLIEGEEHTVHSNPGDFIIATPMAVMNGLVNSGTKFLEPYIWFRINAPDELLGAVTGDIINMRGSFESPILENGKFSLEGIMPVASSLDYPVKLSSRSGGKAKIKTRFHSYIECADEFGIVKPFKGISPLDEAKYILKARKALTEGIKGW